MNPWVLSKVKEICGNDVHETILSIIDSASTINDLPINVLAHILNFTELKDTNKIMRICCKWYEASRLSVFWKDRIATKFRKFIKDDIHFEFVKKHFNLFLFTEVPFKDKLGWMFDRTTPYFREKNKEDDFKYMFSVSPQKPYEHNFYFNDNLNKYAIRCSYSKKSLKSNKWISDGLDITNWFNRSYGVITRKFNAPKKVCCITYITKEGHHFEGNASVDDLVPHGGGKWTFLNGSTLTGEKVAFAGEPHGIGQDGEDDYFAGEKKIKRKKRKINGRKN